MHVLFLEIDDERDWAVASIGPAFIAALLRRHGHRVSLLRVARDMAPEDIVRQVATHSPGLLGVSLTTRQWLRAREVIGALRRRLDVPVIAGGLHPTFDADGVLATPGFDYACLGEGEQAMLELVSRMESGEPVRGIANIQARGEPRPVLRPPFEPIDDLPPLARDMLDERWGVVHMVTQR
ncbi:MAG: cobalamin B12-binding domain-containing protein, partial [Enhydrobacter sp.]|nr:cobalamin B12-binding domain-containing protein [Enhydrobacter sp.]